MGGSGNPPHREHDPAVGAGWEREDGAPSHPAAVWQPWPRYRQRMGPVLPGCWLRGWGSHSGTARGCPRHPGWACGGAKRHPRSQFPLPPPAAPRPAEATFARAGGPAGTVTVASFCETGRSPGPVPGSASAPLPHPSRGHLGSTGGPDTGVPTPNPSCLHWIRFGGSHGLSHPALTRCWLGAGVGARRCWGSPPSPPCTPAHREGQRQGRSPGRCLSTFPARPSVRNGEALLGIRRWLWVAIPLPRHPNTVHRVQAAPAAPGKVAGRLPAVG